MRPRVTLTLLAVFSGLLALSIYVLTLAPTVALVDSGELILAAWEPDIDQNFELARWLLTSLQNSSFGGIP